MIEIKVPDMNDSMSLLTIDRITYNIRFTYNEKYDYWSFGLYDKEGEPIIAMTRIVPSFPLFLYYRKSNIPNGHFAAICEKDTIGRYDFNSGEARFVFIPMDEV